MCCSWSFSDVGKFSKICVLCAGAVCEVERFCFWGTTTKRLSRLIVKEGGQIDFGLKTWVGEACSRVRGLSYNLDFRSIKFDERRVFMIVFKSSSRV